MGEGAESSEPLRWSRFDPLAPEFTADYFGTLRRMQSECPVARSDTHGGFWAITRYDDVCAVSGDWESFTSTEGIAAVPFDNQTIRLAPAEADPPYQRSLRQLLNPYFAPAAVAAYETGIREIIRELLAPLARGDRCEFMSQVADPFPAHTLFRMMLGIDVTELARVMPWLQTMVFEPEKASSVLMDFGTWTFGVFARRRAAPAVDDVIGALLSGTIDGRPLEEFERLQVFTLLILGGLETSSNGLGNIAYHLATNPGLLEELTNEPRLRASAIDELLRFEAPAPAFSRTATRDVVVRNTNIAQGERVVIFYGAANRDPEVFPDADAIDIHRRSNKHLAFGYGTHHCIGAHLAKLELRVALDELLAIAPFRLATPAPLRYRNGLTRGPAELELSLVAS